MLAAGTWVHSGGLWLSCEHNWCPQDQCFPARASTPACLPEWPEAQLKLEIGGQQAGFRLALDEADVETNEETPAYFHGIV